MITKEITAAVRNTFGKGAMRQMRVNGRTPGIVYGGGNEALALEFDSNDLYHELLEIQGRNAVITLKIDNGTERRVLVKELQTDPVRDSLYHADFLDIDVDKPARFAVPLVYTGKAKGVDLGGLLQVEKSEVVLEGLPLAIPDSCTVDITPLAIGDSIAVGSITLPEGVSLVTGADTVCVAVVSPN